MQSNTIDYVLPDGTKLTEKVIAAFNKDGYNVLVTTADQVQSGNTITHISLQKDGMFSTIVDENEWNYIKNEFLIPSIKEGGEANGN